MRRVLLLRDLPLLLPLALLVLGLLQLLMRCDLVRLSADVGDGSRSAGPSDAPLHSCSVRATALYTCWWLVCALGCSHSTTVSPHPSSLLTTSYTVSPPTRRSRPRLTPRLRRRSAVKQRRTWAPYATSTSAPLPMAADTDAFTTGPQCAPSTTAAHQAGCVMMGDASLMTCPWRMLATFMAANSTVSVTAVSAPGRVHAEARVHGVGQQVEDADGQADGVGDGGTVCTSGYSWVTT